MKLELSADEFISLYSFLERAGALSHLRKKMKFMLINTVSRYERASDRELFEQWQHAQSQKINKLSQDNSELRDILTDDSDDDDEQVKVYPRRTLKKKVRGRTKR